MRARAIDARNGDDFEAWFQVFHVTNMERWPDRPGWQRAERLATALDADGPEEHRYFPAEEGGMALGCLDLELFRRENLHVARVDVRVLPEARRRGIGRALVAMAEEAARVTGRRELGGMDEVPIRADYEDTAAPFARRLGFVPVQRMVLRRLVLDDHATLEQAARQAMERATRNGYGLLTFMDRWPDEYVAARCELGRRMSSDVPMGDQQLEEEVWDEARVRQMEARFAAQNRAKVSTVARHEATGALVGYSEVAVPLGARRSVYQHDTLVWREHRGHGLGLAMKAVNHAALAQRFPEVHDISTFNAEENGPMIDVNEAMGYVVEATGTNWCKDISAAP
jgi:GNAT superfamily N-acetyltransferase